MPRMARELRKWREVVGDAAGHTVLACDCAARQPLAPDVEAEPRRDIGAWCTEIAG